MKNIYLYIFSTGSFLVQFLRNLRLHFQWLHHADPSSSCGLQSHSELGRWLHLADTLPQWCLLEILRGFFAHSWVYVICSSFAQAVLNCFSQFESPTLYKYSREIGLHCTLGNPWSSRQNTCLHGDKHRTATRQDSILNPPGDFSWVLVVASNCLGVLWLDPIFTQIQATTTRT